ncbi:Apocytochrome f, partial [Durusdinium trenchii]
MTPKDAKPLTVTCSVQVLEDVLPGDDGKHCECEIILGSAFHKGLNPMWLPEDWSGEEPGERTIPLETMRQLMEARVDPRFREVYQTLGLKGWESDALRRSGWTVTRLATVQGCDPSVLDAIVWRVQEREEAFAVNREKMEDLVKR